MAGSVQPAGRVPPRRRRAAHALLVLALAVGVGTGFAFFTRWLPAWARAEAAVQLGELLGAPVTLGELRPTLAAGLALRGRALEAWPEPGGPALRIDTVTLTISLRGLLHGELRPGRLTLEGVGLTIERGADGAVRPAALAALIERARSIGEPPEAGEAASASPQRAFGGLVSLERARISWRDTSPGAAPAQALLAEISRAEIDLRGGARRLFVDGRVTGVETSSGELEIDARAGEHAQLVLALRDFDLRILRALPASLQLPAAEGILTGVIDASFDRADSPLQRGAVDLDLRLRGLRLALAAPAPVRTPARQAAPAAALALESAGLHASLVYGPDRFSSEATLRTPRETLTATATGARPRRADAALSIALWLDRLDPGRLRELTAMLAPSSRREVATLLGHVTSGNATALELRAAGTLSQLEGLLRGTVRPSSPGFMEVPVLSARLENLGLKLGDVRVEGGRGFVRWQGDRLDARGVEARIDGDPMPVLDLELKGASALLERAGPGVSHHVGPLPGHRALARLLAPATGHEHDPPRWKSLVLELDRVEHEALGWPLAEARAVATPIEDGVHVVLERARLGGVSIRGTGDWFRGPRERVVASVDATRGATSAAPPAARATKRSGWASGRYWLTMTGQASNRLRAIEGFARADGSRVRLFDSTAWLAPAATARGEISFDLAAPDALGWNARFKLDELEFRDFVGLLGGEGDSFTGRVDASASLAGRLAPDVPIHRDLRGDASVVARRGEVLTKLPLLIYLASASGGLNPFASSDRVRYRKMSGAFVLSEGRLRSDTFLLDGPDMRIAWSGSVGLAMPHETTAVVGVFMKGNLTRALGKIPIVNDLLLGQDRTLISLFFETIGPWTAPRVRLIPTKSFTTGPGSILFEGVPSVLRSSIDAISAAIGRLPPAEPDGETPAPDDGTRGGP